MSGEFDSLRVKIESNSDKAKNNISYLIVALNDLRKVTGVTNNSLRETVGILNDLSNVLKGFKSMGDPFKGFYQGAEKAAKSASKLRNAMGGTDSSKNAMVVWGNQGSTAIVKVSQALWDAKTAFDAFKRSTRRGGLLEDKDKNIIDGTYWERNAIGRSSPRMKYARWQNQADERANAWVTASWGRRNANNARQAEVDKAYEYFRQMRDYKPIQPKIDAKAVEAIRESTNKLNILKNVFDMARQSASKFGDAIKGVVSHSRLLNALAHPFKTVGKAVDKATSKVSRFFASIKRIAAYRLIRSALKTLTQAFQEGIGNLYQWSAAVGTSFAPAMDSIATSLLYLKNGFAAMFSPIIEYVAPLIQKLADTLVNAFNWVQKLLSQLLGRDHWYKAVRVQTQYAEKTDDTTKAVKKLRQEIQLMDWDEINNITENTDDGNGGIDTTPTQPNPKDMFVQVAQPLDALEGNTFWERLGSLIGIGWEKLKTWWNSVDWKDLGKKVGQKISSVWKDFKEWWKTIPWDDVWKGIVKVMNDIWTMIDAALQEIFPAYKEFRNRQEHQKEAEQTHQQHYADRRLIEGDANGSFDFRGLSDENAQKQIGKEITNVENALEDLTKQRAETQYQLNHYFDKADGTRDYDRKEKYEWAVNGYKNGDRYATQWFEANYSRLNPDFMNYVGLLTDLEKINGQYDSLLQKREKLQRALQGDTSKESDAFKALAFSAEYLAEKSEEAREELKKVSPDAAIAFSEVIKTFDASDWEGGGRKAYEKIRKAFIARGLSGDALNMAMKAAKAFADKAGWTEAGRKSLMAVRGAIYKSGILKTEYGIVAEEALQAYLSDANWGEGGTITAEGIKKAFLDAGIDKTVAEEASRDLYGYLTGTYNGKSWYEIGTETTEFLKNALTNADIPLKYQQAAASALLSYIQGVDWENGGEMSASALIYAFTQAGIPEDVAIVAAQSMIGWFRGFKPAEIADKTSSQIVTGVQKGISEKAKNLKIVLDALKVEKIPTITIPVNYKLPKTMLQQNIEVNYKGSNGNILQKTSGKIEAYFRANGGYVPQGSLFVAGEVPGQAEMVGNINGRTGVASGQEITGIGDAVWSTGNTTANLLNQLIELVSRKELVISPSATLGKVVAKSNRLYATQTG